MGCSQSKIENDNAKIKSSTWKRQCLHATPLLPSTFLTPCISRTPAPPSVTMLMARLLTTTTTCTRPLLCLLLLLLLLILFHRSLSLRLPPLLLSRLLRLHPLLTITNCFSVWCLCPWLRSSRRSNRWSRLGLRLSKRRKGPNPKAMTHVPNSWSPCIAAYCLSSPLSRWWLPSPLSVMIGIFLSLVFSLSVKPPWPIGSSQ